MIFQNSVNLQADCKNCLPQSRCVMQSEESLIPSSSLEGVVESQTTAFADVNTGVSVGERSSSTYLDTADAVDSADLKGFLSRPVRIAAFTWSQSDAVGLLQTISPWNLFFNNANIKYKLNNFAFLRADLRVKVVINASPFFYGSMRMSYQPLPNFKPTTITSGTAGGFANSELVPYSQQPGVWLKPQMSEGGEMVLPFFYPRAYLKAQVAQDFTNMGTLRFLVYNVLRSANGVTGAGVSVQVYAWAENVTLAGPSVGLAMQSDEYGEGVISGPASTVASVAGLLKKVPIFGKFATATEMGAKAVSGIAKLFGWTNVPVIEDTRPYRPSPFPQLASTELGYPVEKLTLDAKNELSVDPTILGLENKDELVISNFASRQSYLVSTDWTTSTPADTPLFTTKVTPSIGFYTISSAGLQQNTPLSLLSKMFNAWRGDIIFTFRFIATPFHKGRVRISYDPYGDSVQTTADTGPTVFNKIVDIGSETEVDVRIPYQQALSWCYTYSSLSTTFLTTSSTPSLTYTDTFDNGVLSVKVLTLLTAPVSTSTVSMQVFIRGADNIEFSNPKDIGASETQLVMQCDEYIEPRHGDSMAMGKDGAEQCGDRSRLHFGEVVASLRPLLRRSNFIDSTIGTASTLRGYWVYRHPRYPQYYGYDTGGLSSAKGTIVPASNFNFNFVKTTPWHLIANCFIAQRGAIHWHYNWEGPSPQTLQATRRLAASASISVQGTAAGSTSSAFAQGFQSLTLSTSPGVAVTNQLTQAGLSVSYPNNTVFKFESTNPAAIMSPASAGDTYDGSVYEGGAVAVSNNGTDDLSQGRLERYFGVGTDYNLYFFLNVPSSFYISGVVPN